MSDVHHEDAYGRLAGLCDRQGYSLELATPKQGAELRVVGPGGDARLSTPFTAGTDNHAAARLLQKLRTTA